MVRRIIQIDQEKCNGCGACAAACHEGAIGMVNGKAQLLRDDYCDGLGDCLPTCPTPFRFIARTDSSVTPGSGTGWRKVSGSVCIQDSHNDTGR